MQFSNNNQLEGMLHEAAPRLSMLYGPKYWKLKQV